MPPASSDIRYQREESSLAGEQELLIDQSTAATSGCLHSDSLDHLSRFPKSHIFENFETPYLLIFQISNLEIVAFDKAWLGSTCNKNSSTEMATYGRTFVIVEWLSFLYCSSNADHDFRVESTKLSSYTSKVAYRYCHRLATSNSRRHAVFLLCRPNGALRELQENANGLGLKP